MFDCRLLFAIPAHFPPVRKREKIQIFKSEKFNLLSHFACELLIAILMAPVMVIVVIAFVCARKISAHANLSFCSFFCCLFFCQLHIFNSSWNCWFAALHSLHSTFTYLLLKYLLFLCIIFHLVFSFIFPTLIGRQTRTLISAQLKCWFTATAGG